MASNPTAAIGLSSGETNSLMAFGVWSDLEPMLDEIEASGMYGDELTGECRVAAADWGLGDQPAPWECWRITAPRALVDAALAVEPRAYMTIVQAPDDCVIGGDPAACRRVIDAVDGATAIPLGLDMVIHCEAMAPFADTWRNIHTRETHEVPDIRFYTNAVNRAYVPTREAAAEAITRQALEPIDFPATVLQAWEDGVRVFVEHGPRAHPDRGGLENPWRSATSGGRAGPPGTPRAARPRRKRRQAVGARAAGRHRRIRRAHPATA